MILHLRVVPGLGVAVEEIRRPELRSHPAILGGLPHQRGVVREANFVAQRHGIRPGMTLAQAYQQCPDGVFIMPDLPVYEEVWEAVCDVLRELTPLVEPVEMGQAACDLTGCERLGGGVAEMARSVVSRLRQSIGLDPWLGLAGSRLVAQLASMTEGITVVERGQERDFLADLPLTLLPDIDARLALTFQVLGLRTIGQFAALPASAVRQRFGHAGERLHVCARGIDRRPVIPPPERPSVCVRSECDEGSIEDAMAILHRLAERCADELQRRRLAGTVVEVRIVSESPPLPTHQMHLGSGDHVSPDGTPDRDAPAIEEPRKEENALPIPYRIHSMLPQPGMLPSKDPPAAAPQPLPPALRLPAISPIAKTVVRTPIDTAPDLFETAQRLLLQHWPQHTDRPQAIELRVSEFPAPRQLALESLRGLSGVSDDRRYVIAEQEQILAVRYGDASFRRVAQLDPGNILTERRFHLQTGLPWDGP